MNIIKHLKSTLIGLAFLFCALYFEWENWVMFSFIGIGISLLFAEDKIPLFIDKILNKFFGK